MSRRLYFPGDWVVYRKPKCTTRPGRRAQEVDAAAHGDSYIYSVEKFWVVVDVQDDGKLLLQTRRGKRHIIDSSDPRLRRATWWDRIRFRSQFRSLKASGAFPT